MRAELQRDTRHWLIATACLTVAPHTPWLPPWLSALCAILLGATLWQAARARRALPRMLLLFIALAAAAAIKLHFGHFFGKDPGIALLAALLCLKLLESRSSRDARAVVLLAFFLQLGLFLNDQTLAIAALALCGTLAATVALQSLHLSTQPIRIRLRSGATLLAQALPLMVVLFIFFPRIPGPLWGLPADAHSSLSGLSDTMEPGSISELILSEAIAFRAAFDGPLPPPEERYWRGPVLSEFDGRSWRETRFTTAAQPPYVAAGPAYRYRLTLEPHNRHWLLALDYTDQAPPGSRYASDYKLLNPRPLRERTRLDLQARPQTRPGAQEDPAVLAATRQLPATGNPRARALAAELAEPGGGSAKILQRTLDHFRNARYVYSLTPPLASDDSVDDFLFDSRTGFCEHFSSAFVFTLRAAGVAARVVTGYQGGELNPVDGVLVVRQSHAHAWAEVWLPDEGWRRVDPTALAAPARISTGLAEALPTGTVLPVMMRAEFSWLRQIRQRWEAASNHWNQWVLGYDRERQHELLQRFGISDTGWQRLALLMSAGIALLVAALLAWAYARPRRGDALDRAWAALCAKGAGRGHRRQAWEGPLDYGRRLACACPAQAQEVHAIATEYARLRYRPPADGDAVRALAQRIRRLKLQ